MDRLPAIYPKRLPAETLGRDFSLLLRAAKQDPQLSPFQEPVGQKENPHTEEKGTNTRAKALASSSAEGIDPRAARPAAAINTVATAVRARVAPRARQSSELSCRAKRTANGDACAAKQKPEEVGDAKGHNQGVHHPPAG